MVWALNTYFSGVKIDPKYAFLHAFFLICLSYILSKFVNMTKNTPLFPFFHVFAPLNNVRGYIAWSWKTTLISDFFYEDDIQLQIQVPPPPPPGPSCNMFQIGMVWWHHSEKCAFLKHVSDWHCANFVILKPHVKCKVLKGSQLDAFNP